MRDLFQNQYGIKFYTFDLAHAIYWCKVHPQLPLDRENYSINSIVTDLLDIGGDLPAIGYIFHSVKLILDIGKLVKKWPKKYHEWELKNTNIISKLINMEPSEIEKQFYLCSCWASDLNEYLRKTSESTVIFIDSYEALWGKDRSLAKVSSEDKWIRKLIQKSSSCIWVLCGQESPQWEEDSEIEKALWENSIKRHEIVDLPEKDACHLLELSNVLEKEIQDIIISGSAGVPYYLDISIETYESIKEIRGPGPDDFAKVPSDVFSRFIKYLDENKESAIKVLSGPNFWNRDIFNILIKNFIGYPLNGLSTIHKFSFIDKNEIEDDKMEYAPADEAELARISRET
jgi:hypothetical protein